VDQQSRSRVREKKRARDRLLSFAQSHPDCAVGFQDETWWSRYETPSLHAWTEADQPLRLVEQSIPKKDAEPKALACYGLLISCPADPQFSDERVWLRFVKGRPVSPLTIQFLQWSCAKLEAAGKKALFLIWDNAPWHISHQVRDWIREHNRQVRREGHGVRIVACYLPVKSPWLNPIEVHWLHGKRHVAEPDGVLSADELAARIRTYFRCAQEPELAIPE